MVESVWACAEECQPPGSPSAAGYGCLASSRGHTGQLRAGCRRLLQVSVLSSVSGLSTSVSSTTRSTISPGRSSFSRAPSCAGQLHVCPACQADQCPETRAPERESAATQATSLIQPVKIAHGDHHDPEDREPPVHAMHEHGITLHARPTHPTTLMLHSWFPRTRACKPVSPAARAFGGDGKWDALTDPALDAVISAPSVVGGRRLRDRPDRRRPHQPELPRRGRDETSSALRSPRSSSGSIESESRLPPGRRPSGVEPDASAHLPELDSPYHEVDRRRAPLSEGDLEREEVLRPVVDVLQCDPRGPDAQVVVRPVPDSWRTTVASPRSGESRCLMPSHGAREERRGSRRRSRAIRSAAVTRPARRRTSSLGTADVWVVDHEYAGMGNPFFDLGNLSINNALSDDAHRAALLALYFRGAPPAPRSPEVARGSCRTSARRCGCRAASRLLLRRSTSTTSSTRRSTSIGSPRRRRIRVSTTGSRPRKVSERTD